MKRISACCFAVFFISVAFAPKQKAAAPVHIIFAVLQDGTAVEPVAIMEDGQPMETVSGDDDAAVLTAFSEEYYKPGSSYSLIYGGKEKGKVSVVRSNLGSDCGTTTAEITTAAPGIKLKGFEMALATNFKPAKPATGVRKAPAAAEKLAIEKLVTAEFKKNKVLVKGMKMVKLTSIDADNNKVNEIVGTYTVSPAANQRGLLFFIATKSKTGAYTISYSEYRRIKTEDVMSGEIKDVDEGIYQEMLLDILDTDDDGVAELFTMTLSFEGVGFTAYKLNGKTWEKTLDASSYHCAY